jgi:membrane protein YfhO
LRLLQLAGVTHVVALHEAPFADLPPVATIPGLFVPPIRLYSVPAPMPHTFVASRTRTGEGLSGVGTLIDPGFDFRNEVMIPADAPPGPAAARGTSRIVSSAPDRMKLEVESPDGGYVVILESYDPGWRATVDGRTASVVAANALFRGIRLDPGAHAVELVYRPPGLVAGLIVSVLSILAAFVVAWRTSRPSGAAGAALS